MLIFRKSRVPRPSYSLYLKGLHYDSFPSLSVPSPRVAICALLSLPHTDFGAGSHLSGSITYTLIECIDLLQVGDSSSHGFAALLYKIPSPTP